MLKILRRNKDNYMGEEWLSPLDRIQIPDYYKPNPEAQGGEIEIIEERCDACGLCVRICPSDTLVLKRRSVPLKKGKRKITKVMSMSEEPECGERGLMLSRCHEDTCTVDWSSTSYRTQYCR